MSTGPRACLQTQTVKKTSASFSHKTCNSPCRRAAQRVPIPEQGWCFAPYRSPQSVHAGYKDNQSRVCRHGLVCCLQRTSMALATWTNCETGSEMIVAPFENLDKSDLTRCKMTFTDWAYVYDDRDQGPERSVPFDSKPLQ